MHFRHFFPHASPTFLPLGRRHLQGAVDAVDCFVRRGVAAAFDARDGLLPRAGQRRQLLLRQSGRATVANYVAGQRNTRVLDRGKPPLLVRFRQFQNKPVDRRRQKIYDQRFAPKPGGLSVGLKLRVSKESVWLGIRTR